MRKQSTIALACCLGIIGFFAILYGTSLHGIGLSLDSITYLSSARELVDGHGFTTYLGEKLVLQPPLYPVILALFGRFGIDPQQGARYFNALIFGTVVALSTYMSATWFRSFWFPLFAGIWTLFSIPLIVVSIMAWTEPLFILFTLLFLFTMKQYLDQSSLRFLLLGAIFAGLAALTRYIGITLIASGILLIVVFSEEPFVDRIRRALYLSITSSLVLGLWLIRNLLVSNTLMGERVPSSVPLSENLSLTVTTMFQWFFPAQVNDARFLVLVVILVGLVGFALTFVLIRNISKKKNTQPGFDTAAIQVVFSFITIYTVFLVVSSTTTAYDAISSRLLSPIYIPTLILALLVSNAIFQEIPLILQKPIQISAILLMLAWTIIYPIRFNIHLLQWQAEQGAGDYASNAWLESATIRYLEESELRVEDYAIYTNQPEVLYLFLQMNSHLTPREFYYQSTQRTAELSDLQGTWPEIFPALLVWFDASNRSYLYPVEELATIADIALVADLDDGAVYQLSKQD